MRGYGNCEYESYEGGWSDDDDDDDDDDGT